MSSTILRGCPIALALACGCGAHTSAPPVAAVATPPPAPPPTPAKACEVGTARVLEALRGRVEVTVWASTALPEVAAFAKGLDHLFAGYERLAPGKVVHRVIEPKTDADLAEAKADGILPKKNARGESGYLGITFKYKSEKEVIPILEPSAPRAVAYWTAQKILEVEARADNLLHRIGVLAGMDEIKLSEPNLVAGSGGRGPTLEGIFHQALPYYTLEPVYLRNGDAEVDRGLAGLIITQPGKDLSEKELRRIDQFLMLGDKTVAIFASAVNVGAGDANMTASLNAHGLDQLTGGYGIEMNKDAIMDWSRPATLHVMSEGKQLTMGYPFTVLADQDALDTAFPAFLRMEEVVFPFPSTLVPHPAKQPKTKMKIVARTSSRSSSLSGSAIGMRPGRVGVTPTDEVAERAIAVAIEPGCYNGTEECGADDPCNAGILRSAFASRPEAGGAPAESKGKSRLFVVSSSQFLANPYARAGNGNASAGSDKELLMISQPYAQAYLTETILAFKYTLDWMTSGDDLLACARISLGQ
jgi:hypothetical protein